MTPPRRSPSPRQLSLNSPSPPLFNSTDVAGTSGTVTITAEDQYGNLENGSTPYLGTVDFSSTDAQLAGLPATYVFVAGDAGSHTFNNVIFKTAGAQSITATDSVSSAITGTSPSVNVVPAAAHDFLVTTSFANPDVAGTAGTVVVTAKDVYGNTVDSGPNQYLGTIDLTSTDAQTAGLPASYAFLPGDAGSHTFNNVVLKTAGSQSITATDSASSSITGSSRSVNVVPASAHQFIVTTTFSSPDVAGTAGSVIVVAQDLYGNIAKNGPDQYLGTVDLSSTDGQIGGIATHLRLSSQATPDRTRSTTSSSSPPATSRSRRPTRCSARSPAQAHP